MESDERMMSEIRRLHRILNDRRDYLTQAKNALFLYRCMFAGKVSEEREKEVDELIKEINNHLD